jgi:hypothetical protein
MPKVCPSIVQIAPVLALVCGFYASPASAIEQYGNQTIRAYPVNADTRSM